MAIYLHADTWERASVLHHQQIRGALRCAIIVLGSSSLLIQHLPTVNLAFSGWGDPELPESFDDLIPWFKNFEIDHAKVPDWVYTLTNELLEFRDQCEIQTSKNRS